MKKMNCKQLYIFPFLAFVLMLASCGNKKSDQPQGPPPATPVTVTQVSSTDAVYYDEFPATISALDEIDLTSQVSGYVTGIHFKDGQQVRKG
ncbi:MAG: efflux RND transporter periplasmic adaptor subunit, partial [Bacteroidota bacterium]|nr:efflux RND transporter periplasmic adaptor subunit [Bacteroidota bacterium]